MKFKAERKEKTVQIWIQFFPGQSGPVANWYIFKCEFESEIVAELVLDSIRKGMSRQVHSLVERAYELGWKDGKGRKRAHRKFFSSCINTPESNDPAWG